LANYNLTRLQTGDPTIVPLPPKDATPEQLQEFHRKIGAPEQPDGYNEVLTFGDDVKVDPNMIEFGKKAFHEAGLTPTQAKAVAEAWNKFATEQNAQFLEQDNTVNTQELDALKSKWGADLDKNKAAGQRVVQSLGLSNELIERVEGSIG